MISTDGLPDVDTLKRDQVRIILSVSKFIGNLYDNLDYIQNIHKVRILNDADKLEDYLTQFTQTEWFQNLLENVTITTKEIK